MDLYFSGVGLVLGVVAKAERRIAVVVDGRKNLFFSTGCKCKNKLCNWASVCFFSTILKVESTTAGCHVALFQFFLSFKICCTRTDTCFQQTFTGSFNVLGFIPPFSTTELSWYTPRSRGLEGRVDVYRVATHIMVCLCKFVSVCIWNNGQLLFFQICIRVFFTLNILKACFFFCFLVICWVWGELC